ncbi:MAG TPA: hypothetical protein VK929_03990 [Longimicrobiales bacterium]|nr:hypothetical protein [Longimicrobiales bacterium]
MQGIARRLRDVRVGTGLSLRGMQALLAREAGESISHDSIRHYENGTRSVPAVYLHSVCMALGVDPSWLLLGQGQNPVPEGGGGAGEDWTSRVSGARAAWEEFVRHARDAGLPVPVIASSWQRSLAAQVPARPGVVTFRRVSQQELQRRQALSARLLEAARPQMDWLVRDAAPATPAVATLADGDGIILAAVARPTELAAAWGLSPGIDWSEKVLGTNATGTALTLERMVAVLGPEHYMERFHGVAGLAAPVRLSGTTRGALTLWVPVAAAQPALAMAVGFAAHAAVRRLRDADSASDVIFVP